jgi:hypothetical protein
MDHFPLNPDQDFRAHLQSGRFMLQRSRGSGAYVFPPRVAQPGTGARDLEWMAASGLGTVYSTSTVRCKPPLPDYNVALVELAEGPRMMTQVIGIACAEVRIGMPVRARIITDNDEPRLVFEPVSETS